MAFSLRHAKLHLPSTTNVNVAAVGLIIRLRVDASTLFHPMKLGALLGKGSWAAVLGTRYSSKEHPGKWLKNTLQKTV